MERRSSGLRVHVYMCTWDLWACMTETLGMHESLKKNRWRLGQPAVGRPASEAILATIRHFPSSRSLGAAPVEYPYRAPGPHFRGILRVCIFCAGHYRQYDPRARLRMLFYRRRRRRSDRPNGVVFFSIMAVFFLRGALGNAQVCVLRLFPGMTGINICIPQDS